MAQYTLQKLLEEIDQLPKLVDFSYATRRGTSAGSCMLVSVDTITRRLVYRRGGKDQAIIDKQLQKLVNALNECVPFDINAIYGASGNFRSALEAIVARTPNVFLCEIDGRKNLFWDPGNSHAVGEVVFLPPPKRLVGPKQMLEALSVIRMFSERYDKKETDSCVGWMDRIESDITGNIVVEDTSLRTFAAKVFSFLFDSVDRLKRVFDNAELYSAQGDPGTRERLMVKDKERSVYLTGLFAHVSQDAVNALNKNGAANHDRWYAQRSFDGLGGPNYLSLEWSFKEFKEDKPDVPLSLSFPSLRRLITWLYPDYVIDDKMPDAENEPYRLRRKSSLAKTKKIDKFSIAIEEFKAHRMDADWTQVTVGNARKWTYYSVNKGARDYFGELDEQKVRAFGLLELTELFTGVKGQNGDPVFEAMWSGKNGQGWPHILKAFNEDSQKVIGFLGDIAAAPTIIGSFATPDFDRPGGFGGSVISELLMKFHPTVGFKYGSKTAEALELIGLQDFVPHPLGFKQAEYDHVLSLAKMVRDRLDEVGITRCIDDSEPPDLLTVNEFLGWITEHPQQLEEAFKRADVNDLLPSNADRLTAALVSFKSRRGEPWRKNILIAMQGGRVLSQFIHDVIQRLFQEDRLASFFAKCKGKTYNGSGYLDLNSVSTHIPGLFKEVSAVNADLNAVRREDWWRDVGFAYNNKHYYFKRECSRPIAFGAANQKGSFAEFVKDCYPEYEISVSDKDKYTLLKTESVDECSKRWRKFFIEANADVLKRMSDYASFDGFWVEGTDCELHGFREHSEDEKAAVGNFLSQERITPHATSWYLSEENKPQAKGIGCDVMLNLMMKVRPAEFATYSRMIDRMLVFTGVAKKPSPEKITIESYEANKALQGQVLAKMHELGIGKAADDDSPADYLTVDEFAWWLNDAQNQNLVKEKVMSTKMKKPCIDCAEDSKKSIGEALKDKADSMMARLTASLLTKPFVILAGASGTGKSRMVKKLAYMTCRADMLRNAKDETPGNYCMIAVKPNWHDSSELLGYKSSFVGHEYVSSDFVKFILRAFAFPNTPFFVCLDEMNLAPVEQYFAEYLSAVESAGKNSSGEWVGDPLIQRGEFGGDVLNLEPEYELDDGVKTAINEKGLYIPQNLFVVGTVNMDDTTNQFSRKVLDRAMTIMMNEVDFSTLKEGSYEKLTNELRIKNEEIEKFVNRVGFDGRQLDGPFEELLNGIKGAVNNSPFEIGYRFAIETALYREALKFTTGKQGADEAELKDLSQTAVDHLSLMKILPRITGTLTERSTVLDSMTKFFDEQLGMHNQSAMMLDKMKVAAKNNGEYISFWP